MTVVSLPGGLTPPELLERLPPGPGRFLLDSAGGPPDVARYSFLGVRPHLRFTSRGRRVELATEAGMSVCHTDPLALLDRLLAEHAVPARPGLPPFQGGAVGYFSYDLGRLLERLPATAANDLDVPDISLGFYRTVVAVDHQDHRGWVIGPEAEAWAAALTAGTPGVLAQSAPPPAATGLTSNFTRDAYMAAVQRAIDYIRAGDVFQVNLAQRFCAPVPGTGWDLYRRLRAVNPAPFAAYLDCGTFEVVSASPERFLNIDGDTVETRPIKGTRRRGRTPAEDAANAAELLASEKDRAELNMIVDLERNDLGRVCRIGTVQVPDRRRVEAYPTVLHTVATVTGKLKPGIPAGDVLRAAFPGGSITGAPKIRAMEIIEELEGVRRGVYCGALGYLGVSGAVDLNIVIRTFVVKGGRAYFHAGGGIVADSDPAGEYEETLAKAQALVRALGLAAVL